MKNVYHVNTGQHVDMKSGVSRFKNSTFLPAMCPNVLSFSNIVRVELSSHTPTYMRMLCAFFVSAIVKLQEFVTNEPGFFTIEAR